MTAKRTLEERIADEARKETEAMERAKQFAAKKKQLEKRKRTRKKRKRERKKRIEKSVQSV